LLNQGKAFTFINLGLPDTYVEHAKPAESWPIAGLWTRPAFEAAIRQRLTCQRLIMGPQGPLGLRH